MPSAKNTLRSSLLWIGVTVVIITFVTLCARLQSPSDFDYTRVRHATVSIVGFSAEIAGSSGRLARYTASGTAFYINKFYLLTSLHVIEGAKTIYAKNDAGKSIILSLVKEIPEYDLAILSDSGANGSSFLSLSSTFLEVGTKVIVAGFPAGLNEHSVVKGGIISSMDVQFDVANEGKQEKVLLLDMTSNRGFSGAPVVAESGKVVGMVLGRVFENNPNVNLGAFAIPSTVFIARVSGAISDEDQRVK